jgi:hypothetical protein
MHRVLALWACAAVLLAAAPAADAVSYGAMGSKVLSGNTDFNPQYTATAVAAATLCARDTGVAATSTDDLFYINVDGAGTTVAAFDVRLTTADGRNAGSIVGAGDTDVGQSFNSVHPDLTAGCAAFEANLRFLEADGLPGWSLGDLLVWSTDATLGQGDIRLSTTSGTGQDTQSFTAGTIVLTGSTDQANVNNNNGLYPDCTGSPPTGAACASTAILQGAGTFSLRHFDANLNGAVDTGDVVVASHRPADTPAPLSLNIADVVLYAGTGTAGSFGGKVLRTSGDYLVEPEPLCGGAVTAGCLSTAPELGYIRVGAGDSNCDHLVLHFREYDAAGVAQANDVLMYGGGTAACTAIPPASSPAAGTRVTSVATFQGTAFQAATTGFIALVYYVDVNGNSRFDLTDPVYMDKPAAFGGGALLTVTAGDQRLTSVTAGASSFTAGSIVGTSDADISAFAGSAKNPDAGSWAFRKLNNDGANEIALNALSSIIFHDANADTKWDPATESVYRDVGTTANGCGASGTSGCVNSGDFLLHAGSDTALTASTTTSITCPAAADCAFAATTLKTGGSDFRVTGTDTTADAGRGETIVYSKDAVVNDEDYALRVATGSNFGGVATDGQVSCAANACDDEGEHSSDVLYVSRCPAGGCPGRLLQGDIQFSPTMGQRVTATGADFAPSLMALPTAGGVLLRYNRADSTSVADDTFYASTDGATPTIQDARLTAFGSLAAGTVLSSSDTQELTATMVADPAALDTRIAARDIDGSAGYTLNDAVYVNNAGAGMGGTADAVLSAYDLRITGVTGGSQTFSAGTIVLAGNGDLNAGTAYLGLGAWTLGFHDDNLDGVFDNGDVMYALPPGSAALATFPQPPLGAVRLSGSGVASGGGGSPSGGGSNPAPADTTSQSSSSTSETSTTSSSSTSTSVSETETSTTSDAASLNQRLAASLSVRRDGGDNVLTWTDVSGEDGYQVWSHDSPYALVAKLPAGTTTYTDAGASKGTTYLVTAIVGGSELTADQVNDGEVPGYSGVPGGKEAPAGKKGFIPAPTPVIALGALLAVALLTRRRALP